MREITPDDFAMLCFLVLMQNDEGILSKHPDYIKEKTNVLREGVQAFAHLDFPNMKKVNAWCQRWGVELPKQCAEELKMQEQATIELMASGIFL
jgi:hypothetical protein